MKKKSRWLLLGLLPFMTSCIRIQKRTPVEFVPSFSINEIGGYTNMLRFNLNDGLDLTAPFGFYNKNALFAEHDFDRHYMFLATATKEEVSWSDYDTMVYTRLYDVTERNEDCYWEYKTGSDGEYGCYYSKEAKLHLDSTLFDPQYYCLEITLTHVDEYDPDKTQYRHIDLNTRGGIMLFYSIDEDQTVSLATFPEYLPKTTSSRPQASSEEQSSLMEDVFSTEEPLESSEAVA